MNWKVNKKTLTLLAGIVWFLAGVNIFRIGINTWLNHQQNFLIELSLSILIFCLFFFLIFKPICKKNIKRIQQKEKENHPLSFFNAKGWITMIGMMTFGILGRKCGLFPDSFILFFYTGLATALMAAGLLYFYMGFCKVKTTN
ncbi:MAG: hypothetical protein GX963_11500 [Bacteroidales bacterium]|nr:hypothetical protein [Bacteroidales bacterium]